MLTRVELNKEGPRVRNGASSTGVEGMGRPGTRAGPAESASSGFNVKAMVSRACVLGGKDVGLCTCTREPVHRAGDGHVSYQWMLMCSQCPWLPAAEGSGKNSPSLPWRIPDGDGPDVKQNHQEATGPCRLP